MTTTPPTWCTCTTGGINPTCSRHAWQLPKPAPRMDVVIAEARSPAHDCQCPYLKPLADALEAAEAQVARLRATLASVQHYFGPAPQSWPECAEESYASEIAKALYGDPYPADLLAAVRYIVGGECADAGDGCEFCTARATLRRYGLLGAAPVEDA